MIKVEEILAALEYYVGLGTYENIQSTTRLRTLRAAVAQDRELGVATAKALGYTDIN